MPVYEVETANGKWRAEAPTPGHVAKQVSELEMLDKKARYYLGPHLYKSLHNMGNGVLGLLRFLSPSGDIEDLVKASRETGSAAGEAEFGKMIVGTATMAAAMAGVVLPGTPGKAVKKAGEALLEGGDVARKAADDVSVSTSRRGNTLIINKIETPKNLRGKGLAEQKLQQILKEADDQGLQVALSPASDWGASKTRLKKWYARHGFVPNKGRGRDLSISESMIRPAQGLPMDEASRMARAKEMGFTTDVYHGTRHPEAVNEFDLNLAGSNVDSGVMGRGVYASSSPRVAGGYASIGRRAGQDAGAQVLPLKVKMDNPLIVRATDADTGKINAGRWKAEKVISQIKKERPDFDWTGLEHIRDAKAEDWISDEFGDMARGLSDSVNRAGYDGVQLKYNLMGGKYKETEYMIPDPKNIRSRFAKFDPDKAGSSNLLAGIGAGAAIGAPLAMYANRDDGEL